MASTLWFRNRDFFVDFFPRFTCATFDCDIEIFFFKNNKIFSQNGNKRFRKRPLDGVGEEMLKRALSCTNLLGWKIGLIRMRERYGYHGDDIFHARDEGYRWGRATGRIWMILAGAIHFGPASFPLQRRWITPRCRVHYLSKNADKKISFFITRGHAPPLLSSKRDLFFFKEKIVK